MYKFYKIFPSGKEKLVGTYDTTLHPEYHAYINWCRDNDMRWKLVSTYDNTIKFQG